MLDRDGPDAFPFLALARIRSSRSCGAVNRRRVYSGACVGHLNRRQPRRATLLGGLANPRHARQFIGELSQRVRRACLARRRRLRHLGAAGLNAASAVLLGPQVSCARLARRRSTRRWRFGPTCFPLWGCRAHDVLLHRDDGRNDVAVRRADDPDLCCGSGSARSQRCRPHLDIHRRLHSRLVLFGSRLYVLLHAGKDLVYHFGWFQNDAWARLMAHPRMVHPRMVHPRMVHPRMVLNPTRMRPKITCSPGGSTG